MDKLYLSSIAIDITYNCNFRCRHCYNSSGEHCLGMNEMSEEQYLNLAKDIAILSPAQVCLCGGETLLKKDLLCKMARTIKQHNDKILINTVTNGYLMTPEIARELKEAGFFSVQVSLDGATKETYEWLRKKEGAFERAKNAIKYIHETGMQAGTACCPTKKNINEISQIADLAFELGADTFRVQPIMIIGRAKNELKDNTLSEIDYMKLARELKKIKGKYEIQKKSVEWGDPISHVYSMKKYGAYDTLIINAYGDLLISPYIPVAFGNVTKHSINEYFQQDFEKVFQLEIMQKIFDVIDSPENMDVHAIYNEFPALYEADLLHIDLIDEDIETKSKYYVTKLAG